MDKNKPVLIVENCQSGLEPVNEKQQEKKAKYILGGTFTEFGVRNRNDRIYTAEKFLPHLEALLEKKKQTGVIYGEFDHPDVFDTSLARVSHKVESMTYDKTNNRIVGEIQLLSTHWGKEARSLVDDGCPIFVSSRAAGITESDGTVTLKKLFTYDAVADPGFSSAKMEVRSLNELFGYNENANFRIYDISDESKFNELIMDNNNNQFVTKKEMVEYSNYLTEQIESVSKKLSDKAKSEKEEKEILETAELLENLQTQQQKVTKYLDYLAETIQIVVDENKELKNKSKELETSKEKLVEYSNYISENLDKSINYQEYLAENIDKNISYSEYIAENLDKSIDFSEYIAEHVDKNIEYSDYIAENLEKSIDYSEYIAENLDKNICYSEYVAENLDKNIQYSEYVAENLDKNIQYSEYIAEHLDNNIQYSEYIAENVSDTQAYQNYLAESLDKTIDAAKGNKIFEESQENMDFQPSNVEQYYTDEEDEDIVQPSNKEIEGAEGVEGVEGAEETSEEGKEVQEIVQGMNVAIGNQTGTVVATSDEEDIVVVKLDNEGEEGVAGEEVEIMAEKLKPITGNGVMVENETKLSESIQKLISETKKRKVAEEEEPHFFEFLSEKNKQIFRDLTDEDKEKVKVAINESEYYNESDVLKIMNKSLSTEKTFEEKLIENMPDDLRPVYESLEDKYKTSLISQARLYPTLDTPNKIEAFWKSREMERYTKVKENKKVLNESKLIDNSKLSQNQVDSFLNRLNS